MATARPARDRLSGEEPCLDSADGRADQIRRRRARPVRDAGRRHRRGADARLHERGGAAPHPRDRARCTSRAARGTSSGTRARPRGTSSGSSQLRYDCDADALLALVEPAGPACHTGERSCFYREPRGRRTRTPVGRRGQLEPSSSASALAARRDERPEGSYTVKLLDDPELIGEKIREEADEVARAIAEESDERIAEEAADVLYHLAVGLASRGDSARERARRPRRPSRREPRVRRPSSFRRR